MTYSKKFRQIAFVLSLSISLYLLVFGIPSQIARHFRPDSATAAMIPPPEAEGANETAPSAGLSDFIQFKASGEAPFPADEAEKSLVAIKEEFERRFGVPFDEAWVSDSRQDRDPVHYSFPVPEAIRGMVDFWIQVFGRYDKDQYLFHHKDNVAIVYSAIDLSGLDDLTSGLSPSMAGALKDQFILEEKMRLRKMLLGLPQKISGGASLTPEEKRIADLFAREGPSSLSEAADPDNIDTQSGFKNRFLRAIRLSGLYMKEMENIFALKGLPVELTRIPFVESAFNINAVSSAEAVGLWQFIYPTGKRYLKIDSWADERLDPILSTYAAARHLANEYKLLGSWPLTVNAYNTGPGRLLRAREELKTDDIATIIKNFKDPGYQFFSRNYYPEFLAALYVYDNQETFFGPIEKLPPLQYELFMPQESINLKMLAEMVDVDPEVLRNLNPAIAEDVLNGDYSLPAGYLVKIPKNFGPLFARAAARYWRQIQTAEWHVVQEDETTASIADYYRIPLESLEEANNLIPGEPISPGMIIKLPRDSGASTDTGVAMTPEEGSHRAPTEQGGESEVGAEMKEENGIVNQL
ncbi:MAG: transglycosylase SLT domain-containing protein [Deltaproteobacteria bacterium]|nr:transglycosylase SLT domain-containing protein [Deltaproteobacteria bacterium]